MPTNQNANESDVFDGDKVQTRKVYFSKFQHDLLAWVQACAWISECVASALYSRQYEAFEEARKDMNKRFAEKLKKVCSSMPVTSVGMS